MPPLRIIDHLTAPGLDHACQHIGKLHPADALLGEDLGVMAADMLHAAQRFARTVIDEQMLGPLTNGVAVVEDDVRRVGEVPGFVELAARRLVEVFADTLLHLGKLAPGLQHLGVDAERGDARHGRILVTGLLHEGKLPRHNGHDRIVQHDVGVVSDARTRGVGRVVVQVASQLLAQNPHEGPFRSGEKVLPDAAAQIVVVVVGNLFLIFLPGIAFHTCCLSGEAAAVNGACRCWSYRYT